MSQRKWHTQVYVDFGNSELELSWERARQLIESLDGKDRTEVFIGDHQTEAQRYLVVSGGNDSRFIVVVQEGRPAYYHLVHSHAVEDGSMELMVRVGGLPDYYPPHQVHDLSTAVRVAEYYYKTGRRSPAFQWQLGDGSALNKASS